MAAIIPAAAIGGAVGAELPRFFNDAFDQFGSGPGIYLRDGQPEGVVATIGQAVGRAYCRAYDAVSDEYEPSRALKIERACRPYLDSINPDGAPTFATPFFGGQCECSVYSVRADIEFEEDGIAETSFLLRRVRGPLASVTVSDNGTRPTYTFTANNVSDNNTNTPSCRVGLPPLSRTFAPSAGFPDPGTVQLTSVTVTLVDGPDDCGDPAPVYTVPPRPTDPMPPPFRFNPGPNIDIPIDIDVFPDGSVTFNIGGGPITVNPTDEEEEDPGGGDPGDPGDPEPPPGPSDGPPGDVGEPGVPDETEDGGEASGCAPAGSVLVGLKLDIVDAPPLAREYEPGIFRGACYVYMGVLGNLDHDPAGAMLRDGQFVFAEKDNLTCYEVRATLGFNIRVTPYYRTLEPG